MDFGSGNGEVGNGRSPSARREEPAVEAEGLVYRFGDNVAVAGVDLEIAPGEIFGFLGPNGAGKTTTIRMLATLLPPHSGTARVFDHDVVRESEAARRLARTYSGGMRRRLDIAASIVVTPDLLFLDEPTTGLDPGSRNQVWDIVRALVASGTTVLLTTQYLDEADRLADRIAVIDRGTVIAEGTPGQLKASVGLGSLHVRLIDPFQRPEAARLLGERLGEVHLEADPAALSVPCADAD